MRGDYAKGVVMRRAVAIAKDCVESGSCGFAANQREIQQLIACYDLLADRFSVAEVASVERAFATVANILMSGPPLAASYDLAWRLMNPNADRLSAVGLIGLTLRHQPNSSKWTAGEYVEVGWGPLYNHGGGYVLFRIRR